MLNGKKRKFYGKPVAALLLSMTLLAGCSEETYTPEQERTDIEGLVKKATSETTPMEFKKLIEDKLDKASEEGAVELVDLYIYTVFEHGRKMEEIAPAFQDDMKKWAESKKDIMKEEDVKNIENSIFKAFVEELRDADMKMVFLDDKYVAQPNYDAIRETYGKYMNEEMQRYLELSQIDTETQFYDVLTNHVNLELLAERIIRVMDMQSDFPNSKYGPSLQSGESYYREVFFGVGSDLLFSYDDKVNEDTLKVYRNYAKSHKEHKFGKDLQTLIELLETHKYKPHEQIDAYIESLVTSKEQQAEAKKESEKESGKDSEKTSEEQGTNETKK